ncbi:MAG: YceH family protein [Burkholderiales bacterium]
MRELTPVEARIVAVLVEKQATVPDTYPLSLNALVAGCNQKTAREPVLQLDEPSVLAALDDLKRLALVVEVSGSRVVRHEHNLGRVLGVPSQAVALLAVLMLRGPQTAAELRLHSERLHRFADVSSVEGFLDELAGKQPPFVQRLERLPGAREPRWVHLLCGAVDAATLGTAAAPRDHGLDGLLAEQAQLREEVAQLRAMVQRLAEALGVDVEKRTD